jgi:hypothetical protein
LKRTITALAAGLALAGCGGVGGARPGFAPAPYVPIPQPGAGLGNVVGQSAAGLVALFGQPDADVREGTARKLQFESDICVLDTYLYPQSAGEPAVTYLDARQRDGSPIDKASCVAALQLRKQAR